MSPRNAYPQYVEPILTEQMGFAVESLGKEYADEDLYRAENEQGVEFFMSLVKLKGSGTLMIIWEKNPRENNSASSSNIKFGEPAFLTN